MITPLPPPNPAYRGQPATEPVSLGAWHWIVIIAAGAIVATFVTNIIYLTTRTPETYCLDVCSPLGAVAIYQDPGTIRCECEPSRRIR